MNFDDAVASFVSIGIGIAGFSSVVVTLVRQRLTGRIRAIFTALWTQCIGIMLFSLVPIFFASAGFSEHESYVYASKTFFCYLVLAMPLSAFFVFKMVNAAGEQIRFPPVFYLIYVQPVLLLINGRMVESIWLYMIALFWAVTNAFGSFYFMVTELWESEHNDA